MGCDIHAFVEYQSHGSWYSLTDGQWSLDRDYIMFGTMSEGVRVPSEMLVAGHYAPRGVPDDLSFTTFDGYWSQIVEGSEEAAKFNWRRTTTREWASKPSYASKPRTSRYAHEFMEGEDWHSASWLTCEEFSMAVMYRDISNMHLASEARREGRHWGNGDIDRSWLAAASAMRSLGPDSRIVFWFDN